MRFRKMHGIGNDFVLVERFREALAEESLPSLARAMCARHFGVGADGLLLVEAGVQTQLRYRMFNPDGSEGEMCGNGIRCFALFAIEEGLVPGPKMDVETLAGVLHLEVLESNQVRVDMGVAGLLRGTVGMSGPPDETFLDQPLEATAFRASAVSMGNPHLVIQVEDVQSVPLVQVGPELEHHPLFPARTNVHFVQVDSRTLIRMRTWERGAGATLGCGTGACASVVALSRLGTIEPNATVLLPGGELDIEVGPDLRVFMTGPATSVFEGEWPD